MSESIKITEDIVLSKLPKDIAAEKGMVNVQIDGVWYQFPRGTRMIEACRAAKIDVPHYCYHSKLSVPGNCRMCLVQMGMPPRPAPGQEPLRDEMGYETIGWMPRPVIACANTVSENMGIRTTGDLVEKCRNGVMEFLLINHPLDCPICDQAGECRLQEFSLGYGRGISRFLDMKVKKPKNVEIGPRVRLDDERCIMCSRCIRFMDEVAGDPVLGFTQRGTHTTLTVHPGRKLDSNYSLNTVDLCPVGALTSNDFRFQMRVWFLKETPSIDVNCGTGSNITIWSRQDEVYRVTPRQNDAVNSCWMPDSHRLNFHFINSEARLKSPLIRHESLAHEVSSWDKAYEVIMSGFAAIKPSEIAIVASARMTNEEMYLLKLWMQANGLTAWTMIPRSGEPDQLLIASDRNPNTVGAKCIMETDNPYQNFSEIVEGLVNGRFKALMTWGEDAITDVGLTIEQLNALQFFVHVGILESPSAAAAHVVLPVVSFAEKNGTMINLSGRVQRLNRAISSPGTSREDWLVLRDFCRMSNLSTALPSDLEQACAMAFSSNPEMNHVNWKTIGDHGLALIDTGYEIVLLRDERARKAAGMING